MLCPASGCTGDWWCVPTSNCVDVFEGGTTNEMIFAYNSGSTFVALRLQPGPIVSGSYAPVAWVGSTPFLTTPTATEGFGSLTNPIDWTHGAVGPGKVAIWVMVVHGTTITNYTSKPGGPSIQITNTGTLFSPSSAPAGLSVDFGGETGDGGTPDKEDASAEDAGTGGVELVGATPDGGTDPGEPSTTLRGSSVLSSSTQDNSTAQCATGSGGPSCTSFSTCDPSKPPGSDGCQAGGAACDHSICAGTDPSSGAAVCCVTLGGSCSDSSECCPGNGAASCVDAVCQTNGTVSLCVDAGGPPPTDGGGGGPDAGMQTCCFVGQDQSSCANAYEQVPPDGSCDCQLLPATPSCAEQAASGYTAVANCDGFGPCCINVTGSFASCQCINSVEYGYCTGFGFTCASLAGGQANGSVVSTCPAP